MVSASPDRTQPTTASKRDFAKRARNFAKRATGLPGFAMLALGGASGIVLATIAGAFGTIAMPLGQRLAFWTVLIGWNVTKWLGWFTWTVRRREDWGRSAMTGAIVLNAPLAIEIPVTLRLFGVIVPIDPLSIWVQAAAISGTLFVVGRLARRKTGALPDPVDRTILYRAGIRDPAYVGAVTAEDHYCRLHLRDAHSVLVLARFADVVAELATIDGERIHRGAWIATDAVDGAVREGRAWRLVLADGSVLPVSASHVAQVRRRGWLAIKPALGVAQRGRAR